MGAGRGSVIKINLENAELIMLNRAFSLTAGLLHVNMYHYIQEDKVHIVYQVYLTPKAFCQGATLGNAASVL